MENEQIYPSENPSKIIKFVHQKKTLQSNFGEWYSTEGMDFDNYKLSSGNILNKIA